MNTYSLNDQINFEFYYKVLELIQNNDVLLFSLFLFLYRIGRFFIFLRFHMHELFISL